MTSAQVPIHLAPSPPTHDVHSSSFTTSPSVMSPNRMPHPGIPQPPPNHNPLTTTTPHVSEFHMEADELQEQTMVADHDGDEVGKRRGSRMSRIEPPLSVPLTRVSTNESAANMALPAAREQDIAADYQWDPLHSNGRRDSRDANQTQDVTVVMGGEDDIADVNGQLVFAGPDSPKPSPLASRRASHLRLDIKPPSPQPWDLIDPPSDDGRKGVPDFYSSSESRKFHTLQSALNTRPLIPKSSYYFGPPPPDAAFGTQPVGKIGVHHPREVIRIERDYTGGELIQFASIYPLELEGRITPTQFLESINSINEILISAHSLRHSFFDNLLAVFSLQLSRLIVTSHYEKEMQRLQYLFDDLNSQLYNPMGLNIIWPRKVAFLFLEIEYY